MDASGSQQLLDEWDNISDSEFLNIPCEQQTIDPHRPLSRETDCEHSVDFNSPITPTSSVYNHNKETLGQEGVKTDDARGLKRKSLHENSLSPMQRFLKRHLSVTLLCDQSWCEMKTVYSLLKPHLKRKDLQRSEVQTGAEIHLSRELEIQNVVPIDIRTREDAEAIKLLNMSHMISRLETGERVREFPVFGVLEGVFFMGVIDELMYNQKGELVLNELKTRKHNSMPSSAQDKVNCLQLCEAALSHGYLPVIFNRRSQNGTPLCTIKLQQFGDPTDLREAVRYIRYRQPAGQIYAVSESTGSGLLLSYLGECGSSSYVTAAACLSPVFRCQSWFESGPTRPFNWALLLYQKICLSRYKTVLGELVHTDNLFSSCSLKAMEETLFCHSGSKGVTADGGGSWEAYWERNDPLRDIDEVAIPVLCVCSQDDPIRGDDQATLPFELFESNPHFFLLLTAHGGHCGFSTADEGPIVWSHQALLEFFRATTDFFAAEERAKLAARRRGVSGTGKTFRHRSVSTCKRLPVCSHNIHAIYNWQRSYTR
ncbi:protein ABHD15 isoform X1 [Pimephales promelas]|uniref:protein ABHD15 isoform X1 n=1 Tax=Pimephales promelas TaxID=90988 RepID=UPI001955A3B9|nr:protein ABHD15 isoform X1 [Pimephales promelas]XP_039526393.1 protein ABHD15 isoform X1 [Pimephales promelas]